MCLVLLGHDVHAGNECQCCYHVRFSALPDDQVQECTLIFIMMWCLKLEVMLERREEMR